MLWDNGNIWPVEMLWGLRCVPFRSAWGASEFLPHTCSSLNNTDSDIIICTWAPSGLGHSGHHSALPAGGTAISGIRIDICMSDLKLSDFCEVSGTLCAKTLNLFFLLPLTDTNPLDTTTVFISSSFHYFLSYLLSTVSSTLFFSSQIILRKRRPQKTETRLHSPNSVSTGLILGRERSHIPCDTGKIQTKNETRFSSWIYSSFPSPG